MKTYKFTIEETMQIWEALNYACYYAKKELEEDIKLDLQMRCKSIVDRDKRIYGILSILRDIAKENSQIKIEGE